MNAVSVVRQLVVLVAGTLILSVWVFAADKTTTVEGRLVSASCYLPDKSPGATGNDMGGGKHCGSGCLKQGKPAGLLTQDDTFYILDAPSIRLSPYVGQQIRVTGREYSQDIIVPDSVAVRQGGRWLSVDLKFHPDK